MRDDEPVMEEKDGVKTWRLHGLPHREGGPAIVREDGSEEWYWHGKLHRGCSGPAVTRADGTKEWWLWGERHNEPGPAIERPDGSFEYWVFGRKTGGVTREEIDRERSRQSAQRDRDINRDISSGTSRDIPAQKPLRFKKPGP